MMRQPWQIGNVPGPSYANIITDPRIVGSLIRKKRSLLVVGQEASKLKLNEEPLAKNLARLLDKGVHIVATGNAIKAFLDQGIGHVVEMGLVDLTNRIKDSEWGGIDGEGPYELVLFVGISYYLQSQMLATLKNLAPHITKVSLDRFYHPNADWSFPNLDETEWVKKLEAILKDEE